MTLSSLPDNFRALVIGASGGIGRALTCALAADAHLTAENDTERRVMINAIGPIWDGNEVWLVTFGGALFAASRSEASGLPERAETLHLDLEDEKTIEDAVQRASADGPLHLVICATGMLHGEGLSPEKTWRHLDGEALAKAFQVNTIGPALVAKHALSRLDREQRAVFASLSARVGSISDNGFGGWHGYRASKAALNQIVKTCAIELSRKNETALCIALHPGTVDTGLSEPFQANVPEHKLFSPDYAAECLLGVIDTLDTGASGRIFDWAGKEIEP